MLSPAEYEEIRAVVRHELSALEGRVPFAGSYGYLCDVAGQPTFAHTAVGPVLRYVPHPPPARDLTCICPPQSRERVEPSIDWE